MESSRRCFSPKFLVFPRVQRDLGYTLPSYTALFAVNFRAV